MHKSVKCNTTKLKLKKIKSPLKFYSKFWWPTELSGMLADEVVPRDSLKKYIGIRVVKSVII